MNNYAAYLLFDMGPVRGAAATNVKLREDIYLLRATGRGAAWAKAKDLGSTIETITQAYVSRRVKSGTVHREYDRRGWPKPYPRFIFLGISELARIEKPLRHGTIINEFVESIDAAGVGDTVTEASRLKAFHPAGPAFSKEGAARNDEAEWAWADWYFAVEVFAETASGDSGGSKRRTVRLLNVLIEAKGPDQAYERAVADGRFRVRRSTKWTFLGLRNLSVIADRLDRDEVELHWNIWAEHVDEAKRLVPAKKLLKVFKGTSRSL